MSADIVVEEVPGFVRRYGDHVQGGSNNTIVIFGTDRARKGPASLSDGLGHINAPGKGKGTGTIHLIAGRAAKDPDFTKDAAFLYLSQKTDVDTNLGLERVEEKSSQRPAAILKSDAIRIVCKNDLKIATKDGNEFIFMKDKKIKLKVGSNFVHITDDEVFVDIGGSSQLKMNSSQVKASIGSSTLTMTSDGTELKSPKVSTVGGSETVREQWEQEIMNAILNHGHMTAMGPTLPVQAGLPPPNPTIVSGLQSKWIAFKNQTLT